MTVHGDVLAAPIQAEARQPRWWEPRDEVHEQSFTEVQVEGLPWHKVLCQFLGPGIMIAIAYIDPGNYTADLQAGSRFKYKLLWSVLAAHVIGYVFQVLTVKQTLATGRTLSRECGLEYPWMRAWLWFWGETASVASDVGYVMGAAIGLNILFGLDLIYGVLVSILDTFFFLALQSLGHRKLELFCAVLGAVVVCCCVFEISKSGVSASMLTGLIPGWGGVTDSQDTVHTAQEDVSDYILAVCAQIGASVVAPNFFLHSALTMTRRVAGQGEGDQADRDRQLKVSVKWSAVETCIGIFFAFVINSIILLIGGKLYYNPTDPEAANSLVEYAGLLESVLGSASKWIFALSILAGGLSASVTGTLASQYILEGFYDIRVKTWIIRLATRAVSIVPAFFITWAYGDRSGDIIDACQIVVNFAAPFSLVPIVKITGSSLKMGKNANSKAVTGALWILCVALTALNLQAIYAEFDGDYNASTALMITIVAGVPYVLCVLYLMWKPLSVMPDQKNGLVKADSCIEPQ